MNRSAADRERAATQCVVVLNVERSALDCRAAGESIRAAEHQRPAALLGEQEAVLAVVPQDAAKGVCAAGDVQGQDGRAAAAGEQSGQLFVARVEIEDRAAGVASQRQHFVVGDPVAAAELERACGERHGVPCGTDATGGNRNGTGLAQVDAAAAGGGCGDGVAGQVDFVPNRSRADPRSGTQRDRAPRDIRPAPAIGDRAVVGGQCDTAHARAIAVVGGVVRYEARHADRVANDREVIPEAGSIDIDRARIRRVADRDRNETVREPGESWAIKQQRSRTACADADGGRLRERTNRQSAV